MKKKSKAKKIIAVLAAVVVLSVAVIAVYGASGDAAPTMSEAVAMRQDIETHFSFTGNIESHDVQYVQSTSSEPVKRFYVKEGDKVQIGDLLYEVDSNSIQSTMTQAQASMSNANTSLNSAKTNYERMQALFDIGGISLQELEQAESEYTSAQNQVTQASANYQQAQRQYDDTRRYAEVAGEIAEIYVKENESIVMGASIMDIVDYDNLEVKIKIDEYDLSTITEGMDAQVYVEALGKNLTGTLSEIAREASVENGVSYFEAIVVMPQDTSLRIGLTAEIQITTQSVKNVIAVPVAAVSYGDVGAFVQMNGQDGKPQIMPVTVGINNGSMIEITEGLAEGDVVVFSGTDESGQLMMQGGAGVRVGVPGGGGPGDGGGNRQAAGGGE